MAAITKLGEYLSYPFVRYAVIVGILISLCSSFLGVTLVLKRYSFIGDGLSHVAFGAMAVASVLKLANRTALILPVTVICAVILMGRVGGKSRVSGDAAIAMLSTGALAVGYLIMNVFGTSANLSGDVCSTLFGSTSILTLTPARVWLCVILSAVAAAAFILLYDRIFAVTFDEDFALSCNAGAKQIGLVLAVMTAVIVVLAMELVGSLLISALVVFPAMTAMKLCGSFKSVVIASAVISVICAVIGLAVAIVYGTPVGSTIVAVDIAGFAIGCAADTIRSRI